MLVYKGGCHTSQSKKSVIHEAENGSGITLRRELEVGAAAMKNSRYIMIGALDHPVEWPPKRGFWCKRRKKWLPERPGIFRKQEVKECEGRCCRHHKGGTSMVHEQSAIK